LVFIISQKRARKEKKKKRKNNTKRARGTLWEFLLYSFRMVYVCMRVQNEGVRGGGSGGRAKKGWGGKVEKKQCVRTRFGF
jgi:hypothetical protein